MSTPSVSGRMSREIHVAALKAALLLLVGKAPGSVPVPYRVEEITDTGFLYEMIEGNRAKTRLCPVRNQCFLKMRFSSLKSAIAIPFVSCLVRASRNRYS